MRAQEQKAAEPSSLVSVIMAVYDGDRASWLSEAIESILRQSLADFEFLIVGDGLTKPELLNPIGRYADGDSRIRFVQNPQRRGLGFALNTALRFARGEYIIRMDADDFSPRHRFLELVSFMTTHTNVHLAGSYIAEFTSLTQTNPAPVIRYPCDHDTMRVSFPQRNPIAHPSAIFRREVFERAGQYTTFSQTNEDTFLWLSAFRAGCRFANVPKVLYYMRFDQETVGRRIGLKKPFSDLLDRLTVIVQLEAGLRTALFPLGLFVLQLLPGPLYLLARRWLLGRHGAGTIRLETE